MALVQYISVTADGPTTSHLSTFKLLNMSQFFSISITVVPHNMIEDLFSMKMEFYRHKPMVILQILSWMAASATGRLLRIRLGELIPCIASLITKVLLEGAILSVAY